MEKHKNVFGMQQEMSGQTPIGMMLNLLSLLIQTGRSSQTSACFSFPLSQLPAKISPVSKNSPACYFPSGFMWRRSRNSWPAGSCVMSENPLSERSELWISANVLSGFRQALVFRSTAAESPEGNSRRGVLKTPEFYSSSFAQCSAYFTALFHPFSFLSRSSAVISGTNVRSIAQFFRISS